jgi:hypothetical protein
MAVMSKAHQVHAMPNPCQDGAVKELMSRTRKAYARRGELPQKKEALTRDVLEELLASCDDSLRGLRDRRCCCLPGPVAGVAAPKWLAPICVSCAPWLMGNSSTP